LIDRGALGDSINPRSRIGRFLVHYEMLLIAHVGGNPTITQRALITRTARLALHLELMDEKAFGKGGGLTPTDHHFYCVWANSLARHLSKLGFEPTKPPLGKPKFAHVLAEVELTDVELTNE
jgi:hypothetical protein